MLVTVGDWEVEACGVSVFVDECRMRERAKAALFEDSQHPCVLAYV